MDTLCDIFKDDKSYLTIVRNNPTLQCFEYLKSGIMTGTIWIYECDHVPQLIYHTKTTQYLSQVMCQ